MISNNVVISFKKAFLLIILTLFISSLSACTKAEKITVNQCNYVDEYFDYCTKENKKLYENKMNIKESNFNKDNILLEVNSTAGKYDGLAVIDKKNNTIYTSKFTYKKGGKISFSNNSNIICIDGVINSKSLDITKEGNNCLEYKNNELNLLEKSNTKKIYPVEYVKTKLICNYKDCPIKVLDQKSLNYISEENGQDLEFLINGSFNPSYIDLSDKKGKLYLIFYNEGDDNNPTFFACYFLNGEFKVKNIGYVNSIKVDDSSKFQYDSKILNLNE